jgi:methylmalonyl-CoA mutase
MAAVFGGTQSLHTNSYDEALALPSDEAARIARNTQLILQEETGITSVVDPWGGSYFMERLTRDLVDRAWTLIEEIEAHGGMVRAIETGLPKRRIAEAAARRQADIDLGREVVVGVNRYAAQDPVEVPLRDIDAHVVRSRQRDALEGLRVRRSHEAVEAALNALESAARTGRGNLLEFAVAAARARATVGEISGALERAWGRHRASIEVPAGLYGASLQEDDEWRSLREEVEEFRSEFGCAPRMLVAKLGQDGHDRGATVIASGFGDAGFDVRLSPMFANPRDVAMRAIEDGVHVIGVSSLAGAHTTLVPELVHALRSVGGHAIGVVVGGIIPERDEAYLRQLGVLGVYGPGTRIPSAAREILSTLVNRRVS